MSPVLILSILVGLLRTILSGRLLCSPVRMLSFWCLWVWWFLLVSLVKFRNLFMIVRGISRALARKLDCVIRKTCLLTVMDALIIPGF